MKKEVTAEQQDKTEKVRQGGDDDRIVSITEVFVPAMDRAEEQGIFTKLGECISACCKAVEKFINNLLGRDTDKKDMETSVKLSNEQSQNTSQSK